MAIKVKDLKDDALIDVTVNKAYYLMVKNALLFIMTNMKEEEKDKFLNDVKNKEYNSLTESQKAFYTLTLLLAEIEKKAVEENKFEEKTILQPGDEGYTEPTQK